MKYMLIMNTPLDGYDEFLRWPAELIAANTAFMQKLTRDLAASGELVSGEGLESPREAKLVYADGRGVPVTDGVFPESKEFLAGYWIVDVPSEQRAFEIAGEALKAPGMGDKPLMIEVRAIASGPPKKKPAA